MPRKVRRTFDIIAARAMLDRSNLTYASLAEHMGLTRQGVGHWFRGRGEPDVQQLKAMAKAMGCHWLELVTEESTVIYREEDLERWKRLQGLKPEDLAHIDRQLELLSRK